ncbi:hypothetical protein D046_7943B, partial [Vibrio parahaemolyticus V-223/04]
SNAFIFIFFNALLNRKDGG